MLPSTMAPFCAVGETRAHGKEALRKGEGRGGGGRGTCVHAKESRMTTTVAVTMVRMTTGMQWTASDLGLCFHYLWLERCLC